MSDHDHKEMMESLQGITLALLHRALELESNPALCTAALIAAGFMLAGQCGMTKDDLDTVVGITTKDFFEPVSKHGLDSTNQPN